MSLTEFQRSSALTEMGSGLQGNNLPYYVNANEVKKVLLVDESAELTGELYCVRSSKMCGALWSFQ